MKKTKVGVVLAGCGFLDGTDVHEGTLTLLSLANAGADARCLAPRGPQDSVSDHGAQRLADNESRDVLAESARIARCEIADLAFARASELDALIVPGGFGV